MRDYDLAFRRVIIVDCLAEEFVNAASNRDCGGVQSLTSHEYPADQAIGFFFRHKMHLVTRCTSGGKSRQDSDPPVLAYQRRSDVGDLMKRT